MSNTTTMTTTNITARLTTSATDGAFSTSATHTTEQKETSTIVNGAELSVHVTIAIVFGVGAVVVILLCIVFIWCRRKRKHPRPPLPTSHSISSTERLHHRVGRAGTVSTVVGPFDGDKERLSVQLSVDSNYLEPIAEGTTKPHLRQDDIGDNNDNHILYENTHTGTPDLSVKPPKSVATLIDKKQPRPENTRGGGNIPHQILMPKIMNGPKQKDNGNGSVPKEILMPKHVNADRKKNENGSGSLPKISRQEPENSNGSVPKQLPKLQHQILMPKIMNGPRQKDNCNGNVPKEILMPKHVKADRKKNENGSGSLLKISRQEPENSNGSVPKQLPKPISTDNPQQKNKPGGPSTKPKVLETPIPPPRPQFTLSKENQTNGSSNNGKPMSPPENVYYLDLNKVYEKMDPNHATTGSQQPWSPTIYSYVPTGFSPQIDRQDSTSSQNYYNVPTDDDYQNVSLKLAD